MFLEERLLKLTEKIDLLNQKVDLFLPNLETEKGVIHFLEITKETFNSYIDRGIFIENEHFVYDGKKRIFYPDSIIELKKYGIKGKRSISSKQIEVQSIKAKLGIAA
jgi:hypothetical protein